MTIRFTKFDSLDYLDSLEQIGNYLAEAEKENDIVFNSKAQETAKRAEKKLQHEDCELLQMEFGRTPLRSVKGESVKM